MDEKEAEKTKQSFRDWRTEERKVEDDKTRKRLRSKGKKRSSEADDHDKQRLATLKRLKRGDENELERKLRLEKMLAT